MLGILQSYHLEIATRSDDLLSPIKKIGEIIKGQCKVRSYAQIDNSEIRESG